MKKSQKIKIVVMTLLIVCIVVGMNFILCRQPNSKSDSTRVDNFYKLEKDSQDMILIGASTVYTNYSAALAWKEFGYTSYSLGTNMAPMGVAKSMLMEARRTQKNAKLYIIDINGILYNDEQESREGALRLWVDNMPSSKNKDIIINEMVPKDDRLAYQIPFLKYHSNWSKFYDCLKDAYHELTYTDNTNLSVAGMQGNARIDPQKNYVNIKEYTKSIPMHKLSGQHLKELLEYCKSEKIENVVFTNMPRYYSKKMLSERARNNAAKELIKQYGYEVYDMDDYVQEIGLNPEKDFYNPNHLNTYGQVKLTRYLGQLLNNRYHLSSGKKDKSVAQRYDEEYLSYLKVVKWSEEQMKKGKNVRYNYDQVKRILNNQDDKKGKR